MPSKARAFGDFAEELVCTYLKQRRYKILARNVRKPWGEIDIVARDGSVLAFVEVKAQKGRVEGFRPEDHFTVHKQQHLLKTCFSYLAEGRYADDTPYRIDLAAVEVSMSARTARVRYYKNVAYIDH